MQDLHLGPCRFARLPPLANVRIPTPCCIGLSWTWSRACRTCIYRGTNLSGLAEARPWSSQWREAVTRLCRRIWHRRTVTTIPAPQASGPSDEPPRPHTQIPSPSSPVCWLYLHLGPRAPFSPSPCSKAEVRPQVDLGTGTTPNYTALPTYTALFSDVH